MGADAERRAGLKTLVRRVMRQAQFTEVKDWQEAHATLKRSMPDMIVIDWAATLRAIDLHTLLEEAPDVALCDRDGPAQRGRCLHAGESVARQA